MVTTIDAIVAQFLDAISDVMEIPREQLSVQAELRGHGAPTIQPREASGDAIKSTYVDIGNGVNGPNGSYDQIGSNHIDYKVIRMVEDGDLTVPLVLYSWQHHPMPGCCKFAINRWVRSNIKEPELNVSAFNMRRVMARKWNYTTLFASSGPSGSASAELYDRYDKVFSDGSRRLYSIETTRSLDDE